jgi:hypothetical protein
VADYAHLDGSDLGGHLLVASHRERQARNLLDHALVQIHHENWKKSLKMENCPSMWKWQIGVHRENRVLHSSHRYREEENPGVR